MPLLAGPESFPVTLEASPLPHDSGRQWDPGWSQACPEERRGAQSQPTKPSECFSQKLHWACSFSISVNHNRFLLSHTSSLMPPTLSQPAEN